jgi:hypothetical protein
MIPKYPFILHGSEDSLDTDAFFIVPNELFTNCSFQELKELCDTLSKIYDFNGNLVSIENFIVKNFYKGTVDEVNNGMLYTYHLHKQKYFLPVMNKVPRHKEMKLIRCFRGILSMFSRTSMRTLVKQALKSEILADRLDVLESIDFNKQYDFSAKGTTPDIYKFFAFQLAQTHALVCGDIEIYTKKQVIDTYDSGNIYNIIHRLPELDFNYLNILLEDLINYSENLDLNSPVIKTEFGNLNILKEKYDNLIFPK